MEAVAVQTGRPAVLGAMSGTSAAFDARGRLLLWQPHQATGAFVVTVPLVGVDTPYMRVGDWALWAAAGRWPARRARPCSAGPPATAYHAATSPVRIVRRPRESSGARRRAAGLPGLTTQPSPFGHAMALLAHTLIEGQRCRGRCNDTEANAEMVPARPLVQQVTGLAIGQRSGRELRIGGLVHRDGDGDDPRGRRRGHNGCTVSMFNLLGCGGRDADDARSGTQRDHQRADSVGVLGEPVAELGR